MRVPVESADAFTHGAAALQELEGVRRVRGHARHGKCRTSVCRNRCRRWRCAACRGEALMYPVPDRSRGRQQHMQQDILINWSPQETRVAIVESGAVQELHVERTLERGLVGNVYLGKVARVLPGMQSAFIDIGLERAAFLHVADLHRRQRGRAGQPPPRPAARAHREAGVRRPAADGAGDQGPDRHQGRAAVHADQHRRPPAGVPAAGRPRRRVAEDPVRPARGAAAAPAEAGGHAATGGGGGFILRTNGEDASDAELAEDIAYLRKTWARIREAATRLPAGSLLHQDLNLLQRVLRDLVTEETQTIRIDSREQFARAAGLRPRVHAAGRRAAAAVQGRAADLRPVQRRRGDRQGAGPARRAQVRRLPDRRPDRGADHRGRQHRRLRRRAQLRRHHLQDQPGGGAGHRAPAAPAQPGRHHHRRLHRHAARGPPRGRAGRVPQAARRATGSRPWPAASRSWAWWR